MALIVLKSYLNELMFTCFMQKKSNFKELSNPSSLNLLRDVIKVTQTLTILSIISTLQPPYKLTN
jgi:hypothetical protein